MERNKELIERTMQHIVDHPEEHDQATWISNACGTVACFAGWALMLDGVSAQDVLRWSHAAPRYSLVGSRVREVATERLGLTADEAGRLFCAENTRDMLQLMVKDLVNGDKLRATDQYEEEACG
jgi:hypothetical protein